MPHQIISIVNESVASLNVFMKRKSVELTGIDHQRSNSDVVVTHEKKTRLASLNSTSNEFSKDEVTFSTVLENQNAVIGQSMSRGCYNT